MSKAAYSPGFEYDLFVSYARTDDSEKSANGLGWVTEMVRRLESALESRLGGHRPSVFFDERNLASNHDLEELMHAAERSAVFLAVASPAYAEREWTRRELAAFVGRTDDLRRLFAVEFLPLDPGESFPDPLQNHKRAKFWETDEPRSSTPMPLVADGNGPFRNRIHDLAAQIKAQLGAIKVAAALQPAVQDLARAVAEDADRRKKGVVLLAQTTDELEEERLQAARYLEQFGYLIVPTTDYPQGGEAFKAAVNEDLAAADLYVQLLGPRPGRKPPDLPEGYARAQFEAAGRAGIPRLLWRRSDLDPASVVDPDHRNLLGDENVIASGLESFKAEVRRRLEERKAPAKPKRVDPTIIFINADASDVEVAKTIQREFTDRSLTSVIPRFRGSAQDIHSDLEENLLDCDVIIFMYGEAPENWIRRQLKLFSKLRPNSKARAVAVWVGPPDGKPEDYGVGVPDLKHITSKERWTSEPIFKLIEEMHA